MIEMRDFFFRYREGGAPAVRDVSLTIPDGALVVITDIAGSGKSTLAYAMNGIVPQCHPELAGSPVAWADTADEMVAALEGSAGRSVEVAGEGSTVGERGER